MNNEQRRLLDIRMWIDRFLATNDPHCLRIANRIIEDALGSTDSTERPRAESRALHEAWLLSKARESFQRIADEADDAVGEANDFLKLVLDTESSSD